MKKIIALTLSLNLLLTNVFLSSAAFSIDYPLSEGLTYVETTDVLPDGAPSHSYTFKYTPGLSSFPVVAWGKSQKSRKTLLKIAELYGEETVAGINADFFSFYTGIPMGCLMSEGRFLSSPVNNNALAVFEDGTLYIGKPDITSKITYGDSEFDFYYNKYPQIYSLYIMDSTYYESTASDFPCIEIVLKPENYSLTVNSTTQCRVLDVFTETFNNPIPENCFVLTVPQNHASFSVFENVKAGELLYIDVSGSSPWDTASYVIGGGDIIVENSQFIPETVDEYSDKVRYARTAVGICEDGSALFYAVNGKKSGYSSGMTLEELASTLISMGAVTVLNLDGGGSTTVGVKMLGEDEMQVMNYPTDGYPRGIANAILFLNTAIPDGIPSNAVLFPNFYFALNNTTIEIDEVFFDSSMALIEDVYPANSTYTPLSEGVEFADGRLHVTQSDLYERSVKAEYVFDGSKTFSDDKTFYVPSTVDNIYLSADKRVLDPKESTFVSIYAEYNGFEAVSSFESYNWSFTENNAEVLPEGVLAENNVARLHADGTLEIITDTLFTSATLTAEYGGVSSAVTVFVGLPDTVIDNYEWFEEGGEGFRSERALTVTENEYNYETPIKLELIPPSVSIMYKGEFKGKAELVIITSNGDEFILPYKVDTDYSKVTGWTKLTALLPIGLKDAVFIKSPFTSNTEKNAAVDDFTALYGYEVPIFDDINDSWAKEYIDSAYEMGLISGYVDGDKTLFSPSRDITRAEFAKLVTVFKKLNYDLSPENAPAFNDSDLIPDWAAEYVTAVAQNKIMNGRAEADGSLTFAPNDPITRTEAMLVLSRLMPDGGYVFPLTFTDSNLVPDWARLGVEKTVSAGIITGYDDNTIRPQNNITRAEVAVVFSRLYSYVYEKFVTPEDLEKEENTNPSVFNPLA
ncbi:MAG: S-layer homology domain-containing protein [Clostridia bacterium]|nr:S-layer homology domain-containing protein [Clostridia bacterium]